MRNLKKFLALVLATLMVVGAMVATTVSAAEADHSDAVELLNRIDVYRGYGDANMGDKDLVTRWHMALFISRVTTGFTNDSAWNTTTNTTPFTDVAANHYLGSIASAYNAGIIEGVGNNKFDPDANIKYQDALTMVVRALGYTNLDYPLGYIAKAQALGLTDGLNELDNKLETAITRGQTAEIIANALFVERKDGTTFVEDVLKLELAEGVIVATKNQNMEGYDLTDAKKNQVRLSDGTVLNASLLLKDGEKVDDLFGLYVKVATNNGFETLVTAIRGESKTLYNYGDETQFRRMEVGYDPVKKWRNSMIKIDGVDYNCSDIDVYTLNDFNTNTGVMQILYRDADGNVVEVEGADKGKILLFNIDGVLCKDVYDAEPDTLTDVTVLRPATAAELAACYRDADAAFTPGQYSNTYCYTKLVSDNTTADNYDGATGWAKQVVDSKFSEMTMFDDDGDGKWDRAIFVPYSIGKYSTTSTTASSSNKVIDFSTDSVKTSSSRTVTTIDGVKLTAWNGSTAMQGVLDSSVTFEGGKPAKGDTIIYTWNPTTGVLKVVENLGTLKKGNVTELNGRGEYVVIDGTRYNYGLVPANLGGFADADVNLAIFSSAIVNQTYEVKFMVAGGYIVEVASVAPVYDFTSYVVFDPRTDMVKIDNEGNLVVNAIIDATGVKKQIKISDMSNYKIGTRLANELSKNGFTVNQYLVGSTAPGYDCDDMVQAYIDAVTGENEAAMPDLLNKLIYAGRLNANGTYSLLPFGGAGTAVNTADNKTADIITLTYGINDKSYVDASKTVPSADTLIVTKGKFDTTSDSVYVFIGNDGIRVFKGVAKDGAWIDLSASTTKLLNATSACVMVVDTTKAVETLYDATKWTTTSSTPAIDSDYRFLAVVKDTTAAVAASAEAGKSALVVSGLYNVITGQTEMITAPAIAFDKAQEFLDVINYNKVNGALILVSENEKRLEFVGGTATTDYSVFEDYLDELWAADGGAHAWDLGAIKKGEIYTFANETDANSDNVQSFSITTIWGHEGTVEVVDGSVARQFKANSKQGYNNDVTFYKKDANGKVTAFSFALGMSSTVAP